MPITDTAAYMQQRREKRRIKIIALLGSVCVICGASNSLEIDHIDYATKTFHLSGKDLDKSWHLLEEEALKCQLLCSDCHKRKTSSESKLRRPVKHPSEWSYKKGCRCTDCVVTYASVRKKYNSRKRKTLLADTVQGEPGRTVNSE